MTLSLPWLSNLFFIVIRLGTVLLFTPIQAIRQLPVHPRLMLVFTLSLLVMQYVPENTQQEHLTTLLGAVAEFANGLILATSVYACFAIFQIAGQMIESGIGLNTLALFNPSEHQQEPLSSLLLTMLSILLFFGLDGHVWLFKGLVYSFTIIPPGEISIFTHFTAVIQQFGFMFTMAFMIASPMIMTLLIIDLCGAVMTRNMPQVSPYFLTLPIKIMVGLMIFSLMLNQLNPITYSVFNTFFKTWQDIMS